ncbi:dTDP-D-glucose 4-6-dehydratase-like protein [Penicillium coprophilum]|uniref:dTDP-D-glucose 4-6-dehydratase-like protein n=1 Tax=Penicillium coprophilum TaxID=36646 RepID=UPI00239C0AF6|nr:dTDP-D-glucose 4-6-dehydratase-like protein [Penicillium coprophilum]KAJ5178018.1 dTDP-D-glucose 4-6-dehydratase-like protein [Penicillium coprophilum]
MPALHAHSLSALPHLKKGLSLAPARASANDIESQHIILIIQFEPRSDTKDIVIAGGAGFT